MSFAKKAEICRRAEKPTIFYIAHYSQMFDLKAGGFVFQFNQPAKIVVDQIMNPAFLKKLGFNFYLVWLLGFKTIAEGK